MSHTESKGAVTAENRRGVHIRHTQGYAVKLQSLFLIIFFISNVRRLHVQIHILKMFKEMWTIQLVRQTFIKGGGLKRITLYFSVFEF